MANALQRLMARTLGMMTKDDLAAVMEALTVDDLREPGWRLIGDPGGTGAWADPTQIKEVQREAQNWWLKDPLLGQAVNLKRYFILGPGMSFTAEDPECDAALRGFWNDPANRLFFAQGEWFDSLAVYAELALRFYQAPDGSVQVRLIPVTEIADVITDPEDRHRLLYLRRQWTRRTFDQAGKSYHEEAVDELIPGEEVLFVAVNHPPGWVRGVSPFYRAIPWAKAYAEWLQDRARLNKAKGAWAWLRRIKGGAAALAKSTQDLAAKIGGAVRTTSGTGTAELPPPKPGSVITTNEGVEWDVINSRVGADDAKEDGRALKLQICAALNVFEHYFGDASVANLASAKAMELPMRREYEWWQGLMAWILRQVFQRVLEAQVRAGRLPETFTVAKQVWRDGAVVEETTEKQTVDCHIDVNFPSLKGEDNRLDQVKAAQIEQQMAVKSDATLASELGVEDWAQEQARLEKERQTRQARSREEMTGQFPPFTLPEEGQKGE